MSRPPADVPRPARWLAAGVPAGWVVAGAGLLSTSATRWFRRGPGSRLDGLELADNIRSGGLSPSWGLWVAVGVYVLIGLGGAFIATAAVTHPTVLIARGAVAGGCLVVLLLLGRMIPPSNWSGGPTIATFAFGLAVALTTVQLLNPVRN